MVLKRLVQHILDLVWSVTPHTKGPAIWESDRTINYWEKTLYENSGRQKVYELIEKVYKPGTTLIDCGCGIGFDAVRILHRFKEIRYTGVDNSHRMIDQCRKKLQQFPNSRLKHSNVLTLEFEDCSFDIAISINVIMHITDGITVLREICRVCKKHLILQFNYVADNGVYTEHLPIDEFNKRFLDRTSGLPFVSYNPQEIIDVCSSLGFNKTNESRFFLKKYGREAIVLQFSRKAK